MDKAINVPSIKVWDLETKEFLFTLTDKWLTRNAHLCSVETVSVTPDGKRLISASPDKIKVWSLETKKEIFSFEAPSKEPITALAVTPDGKQVIYSTLKIINDIIVVNHVRVLNWETEKKSSKFKDYGGNVINSIVVTPDGTKVIVGVNNSTTSVWNLETGESIFSELGGGIPINVVAVTPDSKQIIAGSHDLDSGAFAGTLSRFDLETGEELSPLGSHPDSINALAVTPDSKGLISASEDNTLKVWNLEVEENPSPIIGYSPSVDAMGISPDRKRLIFGSGEHDDDYENDDDYEDETLEVWELNSEENILGDDEIIEEWNRESGGKLFPLIIDDPGVEELVVTPDGKQVICGSTEKTLRVWSLETGKKLSRLKLHSKAFYSVLRFIYNIVYAITYFVFSGGYRYTPPKSSSIVSCNFREIGLSLIALAITFDGKHLISASDDTIQVWDLETGQELFPLMGYRAVMSVAVTPDGKRLISASADKTLKVWNLETEHGFIRFIRNLITGRQLFTLKDHKDSVNAVAVTPDGTKVISGSSDNTLKVWDLSSRKVIDTFTGHRDSVNAIAVTPDGTKVISGSSDNTLRVWDLSNGDVIAKFTGDSEFIYCTVATDGVTIIAREIEGRLHLLQLEGI